MVTTTFGTGELIKDALDRGCRKILLGIGGSATNDGGLGALGVVFQVAHLDLVVEVPDVAEDGAVLHALHVRSGYDIVPDRTALRTIGYHDAYIRRVRNDVIADSQRGIPEADDLTDFLAPFERESVDDGSIHIHCGDEGVSFAGYRSLLGAGPL